MMALTMRATVERDAGVSRDPYGGRVPDPVILLAGTGALPCWVQPMTERFIADGNKVIHLAKHQLFAHVDANLRDGDVIVKVEDLRGDVLYPNRRVVRALIRRANHLEASLEEYS